MATGCSEWLGKTSGTWRQIPLVLNQLPNRPGIFSTTLLTTKLQSTSVRTRDATRRRCGRCGFPSMKTTVNNGLAGPICGLVQGNRAT
jgi:hypothetical protein